jgi:hypothetical protein
MRQRLKRVYALHMLRSWQQRMREGQAWEWSWAIAYALILFGMVIAAIFWRR